MKPVTRYRKNPFLNELIVPVKDQLVQVSKFGTDDHVLISQSTGEVTGTLVTTKRKVDSDKFLKLFTKNIALTFDLTSAGIKAFSVLAWAIQSQSLQSDEVNLDKFTLEEFLSTQDKKLSLATFWRGLRELEQSKIIAKSVRPGVYFINPNFVFNGDRIGFLTLIEKEQDNPVRPLRVEHEDGTVDDQTGDLFHGQA